MKALKSGESLKYLLKLTIKTSIALLVIIYLLTPGILSVIYILQLKQNINSVPPFVYQHHYKLTKEYEKWLQKRLEKDGAKYAQSVPDTEWPLFSTVYYLWTTEQLQQYYEIHPSSFERAPQDYADKAVRLAAQLILDEDHATWVKKYWGEDYLTKQNLFYRMLVINGLLSYQIITKDAQYQEILQNQINMITNEIDSSEYGLLYDYPEQCYPIDMIPVLFAVQKYDKLFGTDHSRFIEKAYRAYEGATLDKETGLPAYIGDPETGKGIGPARGVEISLLLIWINEIWPDKSTEVFHKYQQAFVQKSRFITGVREFSESYGGTGPLMFEVDAGPIIFSLGTTASTFGMAANQANQDYETAYALKSEAIVASWPILGHRLVIPKLISSISDAPLVGETMILFNMSKVGLEDEENSTVFQTPGIVLLVISIQIMLSLTILLLLAKTSVNDIKKLMQM